MARSEMWTCEACGAKNSRLDGECQFCSCEGQGCKRSSCSDPLHFGPLCDVCGLVALDWKDVPKDYDFSAPRECSDCREPRRI